MKFGDTPAFFVLCWLKVSQGKGKGNWREQGKLPAPYIFPRPQLWPYTGSCVSFLRSVWKIGDGWRWIGSNEGEKITMQRAWPTHILHSANCIPRPVKKEETLHCLFKVTWTQKFLDSVKRTNPRCLTCFKIHRYSVNLGFFHYLDSSLLCSLSRSVAKTCDFSNYSVVRTILEAPKIWVSSILPSKVNSERIAWTGNLCALAAHCIHLHMLRTVTH